jgi:hypothetical protein
MAKKIITTLPGSKMVMIYLMIRKSAYLFFAQEV